MVEKLVVVRPVKYVHLEYDEESDKYSAFKSFRVMFVRGATESSPPHFTDKECCTVEVCVGMLLIEPYLADIERNGFDVFIWHAQHP